MKQFTRKGGDFMNTSCILNKTRSSHAKPNVDGDSLHEVEK